MNCIPDPVDGPDGRKLCPRCGAALAPDDMTEHCKALRCWICGYMHYHVGIRAREPRDAHGVSPRGRKKYKRLNDADRAKVVEMKAQGYKSADLGDLFGVTEETINNIYREHKQAEAVEP
jgi:ribosomal protein S27AE